MTINYEKLWTMLDMQGMGKDQLRKAAGLTAYVFDKIEKGGSVQLDALVKLCNALNCKLSDILEIEYDYSAERAIPDVDFTDTETFANDNEFKMLGYRSLYDLPVQFSALSLQNFLIDSFISCKLSRTACQELIDTLRGFGITLSLPEELEPSIEKLPSHLPDVEEDGADGCLEYQQFYNYLLWKLEKIASDETLKSEVLQKAESLKEEKSYVVETGTLYAQKDSEHFNFEGSSVKKIHDCYPFSVLESVFGAWILESDLYVYTHRIPDIEFVVENYVNTNSSSPAGVLLYTLLVKMGLSSKSVLSCLNLPKKETFEYAIDNLPTYKRLMRKLRHPRFTKCLRSYWAYNRQPVDQDSDLESIGQGMNPYSKYAPDLVESIYTQFIDSIITKIICNIQTGTKVSVALKQFFPQHIIDRTQLNICNWYDDSDSIIEIINLSWKSYYALKNAGLETVSQIIKQHGETRVLSDIIESGLYQVPGLSSTQVEEVLEGLQAFLNQPMTQPLIEKMVRYAESEFLSGVQWPVYECVGFTYTSLKMLLEMKYRDTHAVIEDYETGILQEKCKQLYSEEYTAELLQSVAIISTGVYPITHIVFSDFWKKHLSDNNTSLQDLRDAYVRDLTMPYSVKEIEAYIRTLFPGKSEAFRLLFCTRGCHMKWAAWPAEVFNVDRFSLTKGEVKAYYGLLNSRFHTRLQYVLVKASIPNCTKYILYRIDSGNLTLLKGIPNNFLVNLFESALFNAEITATAQSFAGYFEEEYKKALGYFCMKECLKANTDRSNNIYAPYIKDYQKVLEAKVFNIACSEVQFSFGTKKRLEEAKITMVKDFVYMSIADIQDIPNISDLHVADIVRNCMKLGVFIPEFEQWITSQNSNPSRIMEMGIEELDISARSMNCLKRAGIDTVRDIMLITDPTDLMKVRNMGKKSWDEIEKKLISLGLTIPWAIEVRGMQKDSDTTPLNSSSDHSSQIRSVVDLTNKSNEELKRIRNMGSGNIDDIMQRMQELGASLAAEQSD